MKEALALPNVDRNEAIQAAYKKLKPVDRHVIDECAEKLMKGSPKKAALGRKTALDALASIGMFLNEVERKQAHGR